MKKLRMFFVSLILYAIFGSIQIFAQAPHIYVKANSNEIYESIFLVHCDREGDKSDIWRYENYYNLKFDEKLLCKIDCKIIYPKTLYYFFIEELATKLYDLGCKFDCGLESESEYELKSQLENLMLKYICQALQI